MVLQFSPSQALVLALPAGPALLRRAVRQSTPERRSEQHVTAFRRLLVASLNACIANAKENDRSVERAPEHMLAELALGFGFIFRKKEEAGAVEYWDKFDSVVSIGRKLKRESFTVPLKLLRRENAADPEDRDEVFSGVVGYSLSPVYKGELQFSAASANIVQSNLCDNEQELQNCKAELAQLQKLLVLKNVLKVDVRAVQRAKAGETESGLINIIEETNKKVSYLEAAVFCAVFARHHGLSVTTPLTMDTQHAKKFLADLGDSFKYNEEMLQHYRQACEECFPKHTEEAWTLLQFYLEEVTDVIRMHRVRITQNPAAVEMYFPTQCVSAAALAKPKRRPS